MNLQISLLQVRNENLERMSQYLENVLKACEANIKLVAISKYNNYFIATNKGEKSILKLVEQPTDKTIYESINGSIEEDETFFVSEEELYYPLDLIEDEI